MTETTVLVVEDDARIRKALRAGLEAEGWKVLEAADSEAMFEIMTQRVVGLVTLDLMLGADDGLELAQQLRMRWNVPILMITGRGEPYHRVRGLKSGADDYIVKPFHIREVVMRIRKVLANYEPKVSLRGILTFDDIVLDPSRGTVKHADGTQIDLTGLELKLLELFLRQSGRILSRDEISHDLYGREWSPEDRTIDGHVARLRRKLTAAAEDRSPIRTVRGVGYVFAEDVQPDASMG